MPKADTSIVFKASLKAVRLDAVSFEKLVENISSGTAKVESTFEVGVKSPVGDACSVTIATTIFGQDKESSEVFYKAYAKMTGFYRLEQAVEPELVSELSAAVVERGRLQIYPLIKKLLSDTLRFAGINLNNFPYEIDVPVLAKHDKSSSKGKLEQSTRKIRRKTKA